jgi:hypothetical protein
VVLDLPNFLLALPEIVQTGPEKVLGFLRIGTAKTDKSTFWQFWQWLVLDIGIPFEVITVYPRLKSPMALLRRCSMATR